MRIFIIVIAFIPFLGTAQNSDAFKNELGLDITGFVKFFTDFNSDNNFDYEPTYYLTYRRLMGKHNFRAGIGGEYDNLEKSSTFDSISVYQENDYSFSARIGWEWMSTLSKRWSVFYGGDLRYGYALAKDEAIFFNGGYAQGTEQSANVFGLAPVLGIRFNINDRISLITEATFSFNYGIGKNKQTFIPTPDLAMPEIPDVVAPTTRSVFTTFSQPLALYFVFNI